MIKPSFLVQGLKYVKNPDISSTATTFKVISTSCRPLISKSTSWRIKSLSLNSQLKHCLSANIIHLTWWRWTGKLTKAGWLLSCNLLNLSLSTLLPPGSTMASSASKAWRRIAILKARCAFSDPNATWYVSSDPLFASPSLTSTGTSTSNCWKNSWR